MEPRRSFPGGARRLAAALLLVGCAAAVAVAAAFAPHRARVARDAPIVLIERDGWRYEFHAITGDESLFHLTDEARTRQDLLEVEPETARKLREELLRVLGFASLDELREPYRDAIDRLRGLGYL